MRCVDRRPDGRLRRLAIAAGLLALAPVAAPASPADDSIVARALEAHVTYLASDALAGRLPGTPGFASATDYVARQFRALGLTPGGQGAGFIEPVPLARTLPANKGRLTWRPVRGQPRTLVAGTDYFPGTNPGLPHAAVTAPIVFVGYGVSTPQLGHDDYRGLDVRGKIVVVTSGGPKRLTGDERGILWDMRAKHETAAAHGAAGVIFVQIDPARDAVPFSISTTAAARPELTWVGADGASRAGPSATPLLATLSATGATKVFGPNWRDEMRRGRTADPVYHTLTAAGTLEAVSDTRVERVPSNNLVGLLPGSDDGPGREIVVISAHLDHLGSGRNVPGSDHIYNGALDNAIGVGALIETARALAAAPRDRRRTILFLVTTGEEAGLLGSDYFLNDPAMPIGRIVADINLDMPILTYRFEDMIGYGADHSSLGPTLAGELAANGLPLSPDPNPSDSTFIRSDQFSFARAGIPSLLLWPGRKGPGAAATEDFLAHRYHQPSDDVNHWIDWTSGARFVHIVTDFTMRIANSDNPPNWNAGDRIGLLSKRPSPGRR